MQYSQRDYVDCKRFLICKMQINIFQLTASKCFYISTQPETFGEKDSRLRENGRCPKRRGIAPSIS